jgi:hypothetical protein
MPRPLDEEKAALIVNCAIRHFGERGYANASVKDIAAGAGLSTGTVYTYYADKEALFVAAVNQVWQEFFDGMHRIFDSPATAHDKLSALSRMGMDMLSGLYPLARGMFEQANRLDLVHSQLERLTGELADFLEHNPGIKSLAGSNEGLGRFNLKIWLSGILFTLATVQRPRQHSEIANLEACLRQAFQEYFSVGAST